MTNDESSMPPAGAFSPRAPRSRRAAAGAFISPTPETWRRTPAQLTLAVLLAVAVAGCGGSSSGDSEDRTSLSPTEVATQLQAAIPSITDVIDVPAEDDANDLLGRPGKYDELIFLADDRLGCTGDYDEYATDCGAKIENWPDEDAAKARMKQIQALPFGGAEWDYINDGMLLRVSRDLDPEEAKEYEEAFSHLEEIGSDNPVPRQPTKDKWALVDSGFGTQYGYAWVIARVRNHDDHGGQTVTVNFNLRDARGELLASDSQVSHFSWAGQVLPVATQVTLPRGAKPVSIEATVQVEDDGVFGDQTSDDYGSVKGRIYKPEYADGYGARFEVKNPTSEPLDGTSFQVVCTSADGTIIGGNDAYPDLIPASGSVLVDLDSLYTNLKPAECTGYSAPWM